MSGETDYRTLTSGEKRNSGGACISGTGILSFAVWVIQFVFVTFRLNRLAGGSYILGTANAESLSAAKSWAIVDMVLAIVSFFLWVNMSIAWCYKQRWCAGYKRSGTCYNMYMLPIGFNMNHAFEACIAFAFATAAHTSFSVCAWRLHDRFESLTVAGATALKLFDNLQVAALAVMFVILFVGCINVYRLTWPSLSETLKDARFSAANA